MERKIFSINDADNIVQSPKPANTREEGTIAFRKNAGEVAQECFEKDNREKQHELIIKIEDWDHSNIDKAKLILAFYQKGFHFSSEVFDLLHRIRKDSIAGGEWGLLRQTFKMYRFMCEALEEHTYLELDRARRKAGLSHRQYKVILNFIKDHGVEFIKIKDELEPLLQLEERDLHH